MTLRPRTTDRVAGPTPDRPPRMAPAPQQQSSGISWRSVLLGVAGALLINVLLPYNDFVLNNTNLIGNSLPVAVVILVAAFALLINGPLSRLSSRHRFSSGEMAVALLVMLASCAVPGSALLRYFVPLLVMPFWHAQAYPEFREILSNAQLPTWMFPDMAGVTVEQWMSDPVVVGFHTRWTGEGPPPYAAWLRPAAAWGVFIFAFWGALLAMVALVHQQWYESERLPFPLAHVYLSLIEEPERGCWLNRTLAGRPFWIGFGFVFAIHLWNGAASHWPMYFPPIPVKYALSNILVDAPFVFVDDTMKQASVLFTVIGVTYFISSSVAFSMWFMYVLLQVWKMIVGSAGGEPSIPGGLQMHFGSLMAYGLIILYIGRRHWMMILRQAVGRFHPAESRGRYLSHAAAFWTFVLCVLVMIGWLMAAGATFAGAAFAIAVLLGLLLVVFRISAETGLVYVGVYSPYQSPGSAGIKGLFPMKSFLLGTYIHGTFYDMRENLAVYAGHGVYVSDQAVFGRRSTDEGGATERRTGRRILLLMAAVLLLAYPIAFASHLWTEYAFTSTLDKNQRTPISAWAADGSIPFAVVNPVLDYSRPDQPLAYSRSAYFSVGFAGTVLLGALRLRLAWWPIHPVGLVLLIPPPLGRLWFSIMIGWAAKTLVVRLGGARGYRMGGPFFLGLVVGEAMAAGLWLLVAAGFSATGTPYEAFNALPI